MQARLVRYLCALALVTTGCATTPSVNYTLMSVPEEGGIRFTRITTEGDAVRGPDISRSADYGLRYYVQKTFDVAPAGDMLAFVGVRSDKTNVFLKSTQGGSATTQRTFRDVVFDVAYSPDGERLAFSDLRNESWDVFEINAGTGSAIRQLTNFDQVSRFPSYSPIGNRLMFVQYETSSVGVAANGTQVAMMPFTRFYIWEMDMDRAAFTQYAEGFGHDFSPDGTKLAITRNSPDHGNAEVWVVDLATGTETVIASSPEQGFSQPRFSPDGQTLVFTGVSLRDQTRPDNFDVFTIGLNGANMTQLTFHPGHDLMGQFSPDGGSIYLLSQRGSASGEWNIWRMDLNR